MYIDIHKCMYAHYSFILTDQAIYIYIYGLVYKKNPKHVIFVSCLRVGILQ